MSAAIEIDATRQDRMIAALCRQPGPGGRGEPIRHIETHISHVMLTGTHAYKLKKAIRLPFLDFTTLASRRFYCEEELRLNRRLAPSLYLDVVPITGTPDAPAIGGRETAIDHAVRMTEFPQDALLSAMADRDALLPAHIDRLAATVARFHGEVAAASRDAPYGEPGDVLEVALANFAEIARAPGHAARAPGIARLEDWTRSEHAVRRDTLAARRLAGFIRECHGDLHLANIAWIDEAIAIFDCIEFNDRMRWIDVMSEVAFTVMDLDYRGRRALAYRFLDAYLAATGDYAGIALLRFYAVYRALVRAKVACLRSTQAGASDPREFDRYVDVAGAYASPARRAVIITHGFAGCGKTTISQALLERAGAIRIRSDVERKRLHGLDALASSRSGLASAMYAREATEATYRTAADLARSVVDGGYPAIVDATFLAEWQRDSFRELSRELGVPFVILDIRAHETSLRSRIAQRIERANDASEADMSVLEHQLRTHEPLAAEEDADVIAIDGNVPVDDPIATRALDDALRRIAASAP